MEANNQLRLMIADLFIEFLESKDDPQATAKALAEYKRQRAELVRRIEAEVPTPQKEVKPGDAQIIKLKPLNLAAKRWRTNG